MAAFVEALTNYTENLCRLQASNFGIRHERAEAVRSAKELLSTIAEVTESVGLDDYQIENEEGSVSKHSAASAVTMKFVAKHWGSFYMAIGSKLGVSLLPVTQEPVEEKTIKDFKASLFLTASILAQPWGSRVPGVTPTMYFENVVEKLADLLANHYDALPPSDAFLCKMIRVLRAAIHIDDGQANSLLFKNSWHDVVHNSTQSFPSRNEELAKWAQCKYNRLGVTKAAIVMIGHPRVHIQLEAIRLLITLLEGGNQDVQDELYSILSSGSPASLNLFVNFKAAIQRCAIYCRTHGTRANRDHGTENDGGEEDADEGEPWDESEDEEDELWATKVITLNNAQNDFAFTMDTLRCMQLMAEGHHMNNQRLLCSQPENSVNNDMIAEVVGLLMSIQNNIMESLAAGNTENPELAIRCLEFLQEMVQGPCKSNQVALALHTSFLLVCNRMFGYMEYEIEGGGEHLGDISLKSKIKVCLLLVLYSTLEGVTEAEIPERMIDVLDMNTIHCQVKHLFTLLGLGTEKGGVANCTTKQYLKTEILQHMFFLEKLHTGLSLNDSRSEYFDDPLGFLVEEENTQNGKKLAKFIDENLGTVEVLWNGKIERAFFDLSPVCQKLSSSRVWKRDAYQALHDISPESRSNPVMKGIELVTAMEKIVLEIDLESHLLEGRGALLLPIIKQRGALQECAAYIAVGILILLGLTYGKNDEDWKTHRWSYWIVFGLCIIEVILSVLVCLIFYFHDFQKMTLNSGNSGKIDFGIKRLEGRLKKSFAMSKKGPGDKTDTNEESAVAFGIPAPPLPSTTDKNIFRLDRVFLFLSFWRTWYILALFFATIGGVVHSPFYMTFHITFFFVEFEAGKMMMEAMSKSGTAILRTAVLGILSIFMFAVVTFLLFNDAMSEEDMKPCTTFFQCVGAHLIAGIYGDISSLFTEHLPGDVPDDVNQNLLRQLRSFFVVSFFMFWTFMLSNIFTGLIADAFGAIRDDKNTVQTDSDSRCLVCSIDRFTLDNSGKGFEHHTEYEHNPLAYVFYLHYLRSTAPDRYTGYDSSVAACIKEGGNSKANWLPINRAFVLENLGDSDKEERHKLIKKLDHLWQGLKSVESRLQGLEERRPSQEKNEE
ncbi:hypothetical protein BSKO_12291 [Bryopsis sp. KO-2023]|nr:hypothetical protein BSKO_12291 [Bryopsis sp. KO-2023]